jgi:holo-[acyl-carrier protein] synthase
MEVGTDIIEIKRIDRLIKEWGKHFLNRVFTELEIRDWQRAGKRTSFLAGRFAAKEAFLKAYGNSMQFKDIEILKDDSGKPIINFKIQKATDLAKRTTVSISHTKDIANAVVIINDGIA